MISYEQLMHVHLITILLLTILGIFLLLTVKGAPHHKKLGKIYIVLMVFTSLVSLGMSAKVGPQLLGHFGFIHILSILAITSVLYAWHMAKQGNIIAHQKIMINLYIGGILIAGAFTLFPGRFLHQALFT